jgi:hypothetical protein
MTLEPIAAEPRQLLDHPLEVCVDADRAMALARETGAVCDGVTAPLSYPALWLTEPALRAAVAEICEGEDLVPVHEAQRFDYETPLRIGARYLLSVAMRREAKPPRLVLEALLQTPGGAEVAKLETVLRLFRRAGLTKEGGE